MNWLTRIPFIKGLLREESIKAFRLAQKDILETMRDDLDAQAEELAQKKLQDLLAPVNMGLVVTLDKHNGMVYIGGEKTDDTRLANLKSECEALVKFDLWNVLIETPKRLAEKAMFQDDGVVENQLLKGRAILYTLDTQKKVIEVLRSYGKK